MTEEANPLTAQLYLYKPAWRTSENPLYQFFCCAAQRHQSAWCTDFPCPRLGQCVFGRQCCFASEVQRDFSFNRDTHKEKQFKIALKQLHSRVVAETDDTDSLSCDVYNELWSKCAPCEPGPFKVFAPPYHLTPQDFARHLKLELRTALCRHYTKKGAVHKTHCDVEDAAHTFADFVAPFRDAALQEYFTHWLGVARQSGATGLPQLPLVIMAQHELPYACPKCTRRDRLQVTLSLSPPASFKFPRCVTLCTRCRLTHSLSVYK